MVTVTVAKGPKRPATTTRVREHKPHREYAIEATSS
jgi:hypothetical protein